MYRLIDHKQNILRPKGDQSFHTVCACTAHSLLPLNDLVVKSIKQSEKVTVLGASQLSFHASSLYRPPITA